MNERSILSTTPKINQPVTVYAPASVGNIGPGFDTLGMAVTGMGDRLTGYLESRSGPDRIAAISGAWTDLPDDPKLNTATVAARILLNRIKDLEDVSITVSIQKGVPGSGLGSSAASAVAGAFLAQELLGHPFTIEDLLEAAAQAESAVSGGYFLDNVSASLLGGITVSNSALRQSFRFGTLSGLHLTFLIPKSLVKTSEARKVLPSDVPLQRAIGALSNTAGILTAAHKQDADLFCRMLVDPLIQGYREHLIPYFQELREKAIESGARSFIISGAGSTMLAVTDKSEDGPRIKAFMESFIQRHSLPVLVQSSTIDNEGARRVTPAHI
ncbi:MAG: homoserine kinase [Leptospirales bacterium]